MSDYSKENDEEDLSLGVRCSTACTRAGVAALLFSALALSMLQPLIKGKALDALQKYLLLRIDLKDTLNSLDDDACWKVLVGGLENKAAEMMAIGTFLDYKCEFSSENPSEPKLIRPQSSHLTPTGIEMRKVSNHSVIETTNDEAPPGPPTGFRLLNTEPIFPIHRTVDTLIELGADDKLTVARSFSKRFNYSIYRWANLRYQLIKKNIVKKGILLIPGSSTTEKGNHVPSIPRNDILRFINLEDARKLADYEFPSLDEIDLLTAEHGRLPLPWLVIPIDLMPATTLVEFALLLSVFYFWLFQHEAKLTDSPPAAGTIFSVFGRTKISQVSFKLLASLPPIASGLMALRSLQTSYIVINTIIAFLILLFSGLIVYEARRLINRTNQ